MTKSMVPGELNMKARLIAVYTFLITIVPYSVCQILEMFVRGEAPWKEGNWFFANMRQKVLVKHGKISAEDRDRRYLHSLKYIKTGAKVVDLGSGGGRLQLVLQQHDPSIEYVGIDFDQDIVDEANASGLNVKHMDFSDVAALEKFLQEEKPDVVFLMYAIDFLTEPEKIIETITRNCDQLIFGGKNHGHYVQRFRFLFGMAPVTGESLYDAYLLARAEKKGIYSRVSFAARNWPRDHNQYLRIWTHREFVAMFEDFEMDWQVIAYRGFRIGSHYRRMFLGGLRAMGIQYCVTKRK